jgi:hypothetical protein
MLAVFFSAALEKNGSMRSLKKDDEANTLALTKLTIETRNLLTKTRLAQRRGYLGTKKNFVRARIQLWPTELNLALADEATA